MLLDPTFQKVDTKRKNAVDQVNTTRRFENHRSRILKLMIKRTQQIPELTLWKVKRCLSKKDWNTMKNYEIKSFKKCKSWFSFQEIKSKVSIEHSNLIWFSWRSNSEKLIWVLYEKNAEGVFREKSTRYDSYYAAHGVYGIHLTQVLEVDFK